MCNRLHVLCRIEIYPFDWAISVDSNRVFLGPFITSRRIVGCPNSSCVGVARLITETGVPAMPCRCCSWITFHRWMLWNWCGCFSDSSSAFRHWRTQDVILEPEPIPPSIIYISLHIQGGSVAEWLACWTQAQKGPGSNRSRDTVG